MKATGVKAFEAEASRGSSQGRRQETRWNRPPCGVRISSALGTHARPREATRTPERLTRTPTVGELLQSGYRYAFALTRHPGDAEDLAQEAWLNLNRRYGCVESRAILFATVRNLFIDHCRRRKVVQFESIDQEDPPELPSIPPGDPGVKGDLDHLLAILRPHEREILFLHYVHGHTAEEIARMTSRPRGTVLSLIHRAIAKLREAAASASRSSGCD